MLFARFEFDVTLASQDYVVRLIFSLACKELLTSFDSYELVWIFGEAIT